MDLTKVYAQNAGKKNIDLTLSINPLGCSPCAIRALKNFAADDVSRYPNTGPLINALTKKFRVSKDNIVLGNGSEQLIKLISQTFLKKGDLALVQVASFPLFTKESQIAGAKVAFFDPENPLSSVNPSVLFMSNPSTPTGEVFSRKTVTSLIKTFPDAIIVIDEANGEFADGASFINNAKESSNVIILRTFSKVLGLAGVRIGCAIGASVIIQKLQDVQQAFVVSSIACKLAVASLNDQEFISKTKKFIATERATLTSALVKRGFTVSNSVTNNLFVSRPDAKQIIQQLSDRSVSVIDGSFFPGLTTPGFRISIKDKKTNKLFLQKLDEVLACTNKNKLILSKEVV